MARYTGAKCKICRREGRKLFLKGDRCYTDKCPIDRKGAVPPGELPKRRRPRVTDFGLRLREKQRVKRTYGLLEKQFSRYVKEASQNKEEFGTALVQKLETRLDNVVRRLGFVRSINRARQLVSHGHILVDGQKVDIPSYNVKRGQVISLKSDSKMIPVVEKILEKTEDQIIPGWLSRKAITGKIKQLPTADDLTDEFNFALVVEYYSR